MYAGHKERKGNSLELIKYTLALSAHLVAVMPLLVHHLHLVLLDEPLENVLGIVCLFVYTHKKGG